MAYQLRLATRNRKFLGSTPGRDRCQVTSEYDSVKVHWWIQKLASAVARAYNRVKGLGAQLGPWADPLVMGSGAKPL